MHPLSTRFCKILYHVCVYIYNVCLTHSLTHSLTNSLSLSLSLSHSLYHSHSDIARAASCGRVCSGTAGDPQDSGSQWCPRRNRPGGKTESFPQRIADYERERKPQVVSQATLANGLCIKQSSPVMIHSTPASSAADLSD